MSNRRQALVGISILVVVAVIAVQLWRVPLMPADALRKSLLRHTPIGTSASEVQAMLARRGWLDHNYNGTTGFARQKGGEPMTVVGTSSLRANLGHYYLPFRTDVTAFWGFDESGRLIDIWVWKTVDAL